VEQVMAKHEEDLKEPIDTWEDMKLEMQTRFVPDHYNCDLFNKLQKLTQGTKSVEEYYKEMELTMMCLKLEEKQEQTLARFFNGLNHPIKRIVEFLPYTTVCDLIHKATQAEHQLQDDAKYERTKGFFDSRNSSASTPSHHLHLCPSLSPNHHNQQLKFTHLLQQPPPKHHRHHPK
jgi:hypothetical protein